MKKQAPKKHHQVVIINGERYYKPYTKEAIEKAEEFKHNQFVHFNPVGETDVRSVKQLGLYFQSCKFSSERVDDINFRTYKSTDSFTRAECDLVDWDSALYLPDHRLQWAPYLSISFSNMKHLQACDYFTDATQVLANRTPGYGYDVERYISDVKNSCKGRNY